MNDVLTGPIECREYLKAGPRLLKKGSNRVKYCFVADTLVQQKFEDAAKKREGKKRKEIIQNTPYK